MIAGRASVPNAPQLHARTSTRVTGRAPVPNLVHVRTVDWPQREEFLRELDRLKDRHGYRYDAALAEAAGISHTAISNWRNGKVRPSVPTLQRLAGVLDVQPSTLMAASGLVIDEAGDQPTEIPDELVKLLRQYENADDERRAALLARVAFVVEWFEATEADASPSRRTRTG